MFHQSMSRSQRAKGFKAKKILQVALLLAVVVWLLYKTKHSYDGKEYVGTDNNKLSKGDIDIYFGRKVNAGSQNGISIDPHRRNSDETTEIEENGGGQADAFDWHTEEKAEEEALKKENEESQEEITNSGEEETHPEQQGKVDDNAGSHVTGEVNSEGTEEVIHLHSRTDSDNFDHNGNRNGVGDSLEENGLPKDDAFVQNFTPNGENSGNEEAKTTNEETFSNSTDQTDSIETATTDTISEDENANLLNSTEENNVVMSDNNWAPIREEESQVDHVFEDEITGNSFSEEAKTDTRSDNELAKLSLADEQNNAEKAANNEASRREAIESQRANASDAEVTTNNTVKEEKDPKSGDEVANSSLANKDEHIELSANSEDAKVEAVESQGYGASDDESSGKNSLEEASSETSDDEVANSSQNNEQNNLEIPTNETPNGEAVESRGDGAFEVEITGNNALEDTKTEPKSNDVTSFDLDNSIQLSVGNGTTEIGQEGSTGSESSSSEEELIDLTKSAEL